MADCDFGGILTVLVISMVFLAFQRFLDDFGHFEVSEGGILVIFIRFRVFLVILEVT